MPKRIQRKRTKDWRMPEGAVYVGRGSAWGNPFVVGRDGTKQECVDLYRKLVAGYLCITAKPPVSDQLRVLNYLLEHNIKQLRGKDLACWCSLTDGKPCHADVLIELANLPNQGD